MQSIYARTAVVSMSALLASLSSQSALAQASTQRITPPGTDKSAETRTLEIAPKSCRPIGR